MNSGSGRTAVRCIACYAVRATTTLAVYSCVDCGRTMDHDERSPVSFYRFVFSREYLLGSAVRLATLQRVDAVPLVREPPWEIEPHPAAGLASLFRGWGSRSRASRSRSVSSRSRMSAAPKRAETADRSMRSKNSSVRRKACSVSASC